MQLFKSLICWQGYDCRKRFAIINAASYVGFALLTTIFASSAILSIIALVLALFFSGASLKRRLNDADLSNHWLAVPLSLFLIIGLLIIFTSSAITFGLLILPLLLSAALLTYPSKVKRKYILGYDGPINLSELTQAHQLSQRNNRIEPTLMGQEQFASIDEPAFSHAETEQQSVQASKTVQKDQQDIGEKIRMMLFNKKSIVITLATLAVLLVVALIFSMTRSLSDSEGNIASPNLVAPVAEARLHPISFPDNFHLMLSENNGVSINWEGDDTSNDEIWSLSSALGDKSCENIKFNNGDKFRSLRVSVESGSQYYATFSPLDTKKIIQGVAFRGTFTLCGYTFSLKGSQAILGKNENYADMVEY